jgi:hypothetical protein
MHGGSVDMDGRGGGIGFWDGRIGGWAEGNDFWGAGIGFLSRGSGIGGASQVKRGAMPMATAKAKARRERKSGFMSTKMNGDCQKWN